MRHSSTETVSIGIAIFLLVSILLPPTALRGQTAGMIHWDLELTTSDADLSLDDRLLAVTKEVHCPSTKLGEPISEFVELWSYREHKMVASTLLANYPCRLRKPNPIRFAGDDSTLLAADPRAIHVLDPSTLNTVRVIRPSLPEGCDISILETSAIGHFVVIAAWDFPVEEKPCSKLLVYDYETGRLMLDWTAPDNVSSIAWKPDATLFAVATFYPHIQENIYVFSGADWSLTRTLTANEPRSLAFSDTRLYAVPSSYSKGSVINRHLGMEVFDVPAWSRRKDVVLSKQDIHGSVSFSKGRLLANTGAISADFNWMHGHTDVDVDNNQFTVWDDNGQSVVVASPRFDRPGGRFWITMRLSRSGRMALFDPEHPEIFELPD